MLTPEDRARLQRIVSEDSLTSEDEILLALLPEAMDEFTSMGYAIPDDMTIGELLDNAEILEEAEVLYTLQEAPYTGYLNKGSRANPPKATTSSTSTAAAPAKALPTRTVSTKPATPTVHTPTKKPTLKTKGGSPSKTKSGIKAFAKAGQKVSGRGKEAPQKGVLNWIAKKAGERYGQTKKALSGIKTAFQSGVKKASA